MAFGGMSIILVAVYGLLALFLIIELGLTGYLVHKNNRWWHDSPSSFAFMLFNSIWTLLVLIYLALATTFISAIYHALAALVLIAITMIFWFAGATAMAAFIGVPDCHGNTYCQSAQAAVAFGYFIWVIFLGLLVMEGLAYMKGRGPSARADRGAKTQQPYPAA